MSDDEQYYNDPKYHAKYTHKTMLPNSDFGSILGMVGKYAMGQMSPPGSNYYKMPTTSGVSALDETVSKNYTDPAISRMISEGFAQGLLPFTKAVDGLVQSLKALGMGDLAKTISNQNQAGGLVGMVAPTIAGSEMYKNAMGIDMAGMMEKFLRNANQLGRQTYAYKGVEDMQGHAQLNRESAGAFVTRLMDKHTTSTGWDTSNTAGMGSEELTSMVNAAASLNISYNKQVNEDGAYNGTGRAVQRFDMSAGIDEVMDMDEYNSAPTQADKDKLKADATVGLVDMKMQMTDQLVNMKLAMNTTGIDFGKGTDALKNVARFTGQEVPHMDFTVAAGRLSEFSAKNRSTGWLDQQAANVMEGAAAAGEQLGYGTNRSYRFSREMLDKTQALALERGASSPAERKKIADNLISGTMRVENSETGRLVRLGTEGARLQKNTEIAAIQQDKNFTEKQKASKIADVKQKYTKMESAMDTALKKGDYNTFARVAGSATGLGGEQLSSIAKSGAETTDYLKAQTAILTKFGGSQERVTDAINRGNKVRDDLVKLQSAGALRKAKAEAKSATSLDYREMVGRDFTSKEKEAISQETKKELLDKVNASGLKGDQLKLAQGLIHGADLSGGADKLDDALKQFGVKGFEEGGLATEAYASVEARHTAKFVRDNRKSISYKNAIETLSETGAYMDQLKGLSPDERRKISSDVDKAGTSKEKFDIMKKAFTEAGGAGVVFDKALDLGKDKTHTAVTASGESAKKGANVSIMKATGLTTEVHKDLVTDTSKTQLDANIGAASIRNSAMVMEKLKSMQPQRLLQLVGTAGKRVLGKGADRDTVAKFAKDNANFKGDRKGAQGLVTNLLKRLSSPDTIKSLREQIFREIDQKDMSDAMKEGAPDPEVSKGFTERSQDSTELLKGTSVKPLEVVITEDKSNRGNEISETGNKKE